MFISSNQLTEPNIFEGYAWVENDLIVGQEGFNQYLSETSKKILPGEDGCYAVAIGSADGIHIGTDYRGLMRLFLYRNGNKWAVSSSLYDLVTNARLMGWPLTLLNDTVSAFLTGTGFAAQPAALAAHFAEISLVPSTFSVHVIDDRVTLKFRETQPEVSYKEALENFISTWKNRLSTLSNNPDTYLRFDLSGGIDSRAVIAFAISNGNILGNGQRTRIESSRKPHAVKDLESATEIANHFGFVLNSENQTKSLFRNSMSSVVEGSSAMDKWKRHSLGVYSPVYLYTSEPKPQLVHAHGAGGGNFRPTYRSINGKLATAKEFMKASDYLVWRQRSINDITALHGFSPAVSKELLHYREFRNRFHFGHRPQHSFVYMPLESKLTDPITDRQDNRDGRQIYYDIMESLEPGLSRFKYDSEEKYPTAENWEKLTTVETSTAVAGQIYHVGDETMTTGTTRKESVSEWIDSAASRFGSKLVSQVLPAKYSEPIQALLYSLDNRLSLPNANSPSMQGLSHALTVDFLLNPTTKL